MAEAIGIAAAIAQFADVGFHLSERLHRFCIDVRDVPDRIKNLLQDLDQQLSMMRDVRNNQLAVPPSNTSSTLTSLLHAHVTLANSLHDMLEGLVDGYHDRLLQKGWRRLWHSRACK